jgi:hypothetical protein
MNNEFMKTDFAADAVVAVLAQRFFAVHQRGAKHDNSQ